MAVDVFTEGDSLIHSPLQLAVACRDLLEPLRPRKPLHFWHVHVYLLDLLQRCLRSLIRIAILAANSFWHLRRLDEV